MEGPLAAKVAVSGVPYAVDKPYDYLLPEALSGTARPGMRALIPFGAGNRRTQGLILAIGPGESSPRMKSVLSLLDEQPVLDAEGIQLALWMR